MSQVGKFLAACKGTTSVKASPDAAMQIMSALEETPESDVIQLVGSSKKTVVDEWGVEDTEQECLLMPSSVIVGGHLNLISEEDVSRKTTRKGPKTWGDLKEVLHETYSPEETGTSPAEAKITPVAEIRPALYRAPRELRSAKVDVSSHDVFPELQPVSAKQISVLSSVKETKKKNQKEDRQKDNASSSSHPLLTTDVSTNSYMAIEEFLKDIQIPSIAVQYDDEASRIKYVGRKKRPVNPLCTKQLSAIG